MNRRVAIRALRRLDKGDVRPDQDLVVVEAPLALHLHGDGAAPLALGILLRTPGDDEDLVTGLLNAEGVIRRAADIAAIDIRRDHDPEGAADVADVTLAPGLDLPAVARARAQVTTSACGLCGRLEIAAVDRRAPAPAGARRMPLDQLAALASRLLPGQATFAETGGLHAAGLFTADGTLVVLREDVGRHNAVDKVVGAAMRAGRLTPGLVVAVSGRAAFEIVQKAAMAGASAVVAIGAASSLAVDAARAAGVTLVAFARDGRGNVYCG